MRVACSNLVFNGKKYVKKQQQKGAKIILVNKMIWQGDGRKVHLTGNI